MRSLFVYYVDDRLSAAELTAARLDGHLVELGDAFIPADAVETAALRAASLRGILSDDLAATQLSAAWIHGAAVLPPARHAVQRAVPRRLHQVLGRRFVYSDRALAAGDVQRIGGVSVTTRLRTLIDLARRGDGAHVAAAHAMMRLWPDLAPAALARIAESGPFPGKRSAAALLREGARADAAQDEVTRYTS